MLLFFANDFSSDHNAIARDNKIPSFLKKSIFLHVKTFLLLMLADENEVKLRYQ